MFSRVFKPSKSSNPRDANPYSTGSFPHALFACALLTVGITLFHQSINLILIKFVAIGTRDDLYIAVIEYFWVCCWSNLLFGGGGGGGGEGWSSSSFSFS